MIRLRITLISTLLFALTALMPYFAAAQGTSASPRQEKLLNGMKLLLWNRPGESNVSVRLRIHSGSAFDPQEKEGVMQLLADSFFPTEESRNFFAEELGGSLDIETNYDYIQINAVGKSSELLEVLETVAQAVTNPSVDRETVAALKKSLADRLRKLETESAYIADRAVAQRLFGTFPYGRPSLGTLASIERIDFADLVFAKGRLLTADNATLSVSGNIDAVNTFRAVRRFFGPWQRSDRKIPATFRQPDDPSPEVAVVDSSVPGVNEFRVATRGFARSDADHFAAVMLGRVLNERLQARGGGRAYARSDSHVLPGAFVFGISTNDSSSPGHFDGDAASDSRLARFLGGPVTESEFARARLLTLDSLKANEMDLWLDLDTFRLSSAKAELDRAQAVKLSDVQRVLEKISKQPAAFVQLIYRRGSVTEGKDADQY